MKPVTAIMAWKGRKLMCNGVCVACVWFQINEPHDIWIGDIVGLAYMRSASERTARRAVNRRFKLPLDFGESK